VAMDINIFKKKERGRLKKRWIDRIQNNLEIAGVCKG